ncbi:class I SAM-dependent methyltransferase [Nesterenkonia populi]|uniref:class I SAM-dependent methyltransferase n=1 Tax=Nesterenkonia populi TaxID=1591087 RepID=UPI0011BFCB2D|nr:class I SAM-dependent methyltransferase [Nesterenkonia populi]
MKNASELAKDVKLTPAEKGDPVAAQSDEQRRISEYWSRWAGEYEAYQAQRREAEGESSVWEGIWSAGLPQPPSQVLDLGTGSGAVAFLLAGMGHRVTGIDLAEGMLAEARRRSGYSANPMFGFGDAAGPQFDDAAFDALTARYVLWTLRTPDQALAEWLRILKPGGVLVAVDSLWFPEGLIAHEHEEDHSGARGQDFRRAYQGQEQDLPLAEAGSIGAFADRIRAAGFAEVTAEELPELKEADQEYGVAPGHRVQMQYRIRAVKPIS